MFRFIFQGERVESSVFHREFCQHSPGTILVDEADVGEDGHDGKLGMVYITVQYLLQTHTNFLTILIAQADQNLRSLVFINSQYQWWISSFRSMADILAHWVHSSCDGGALLCT